ncbi:hypothetical protein P0R31_23565 [Bradyrhizobium yuanmingense]|uniref:hypothetical protein n=1 Tax=Bradyrhizobium yuanmingense TaxID=108015 RepID=UPI0023B8E068|nr:hypothetical protein [Bradyrhizobium yuanmingense]MDF0520223.1 hypothetical protein [Bradyrhizobium yuanmingense]
MTDIRIALSDKAIAQLPKPEDGWYLARDTELKGFSWLWGSGRGRSLFKVIFDKVESEPQPSEYRLEMRAS